MLHKRQFLPKTVWKTQMILQHAINGIMNIIRLFLCIPIKLYYCCMHKNCRSSLSHTPFIPSPSSVGCGKSCKFSGRQLPRIYQPNRITISSIPHKNPLQCLIQHFIYMSILFMMDHNKQLLCMQSRAQFSVNYRFEVIVMPQFATSMLITAMQIHLIELF